MNAAASRRRAMAAGSERSRRGKQEREESQEGKEEAWEERKRKIRRNTVFSATTAIYTEVFSGTANGILDRKSVV